MKKEIDYLTEKLHEVAPDLKITKDLGWGEGQKGGRCITDFYREVTFSRELTHEELNQVKELMRQEHCPGWTGVSGRNKEDLTYIFSTTWDSSD